MQNFDVAFLSDKYDCYRIPLCSWLTSFGVQEEFSFVSHVICLTHAFHLTSHVKACNSHFSQRNNLCFLTVGQQFPSKLTCLQVSFLLRSAEASPQLTVVSLSKTISCMCVLSPNGKR